MVHRFLPAATDVLCESASLHTLRCREVGTREGHQVQWSPGQAAIVMTIVSTVAYAGFFSPRVRLLCSTPSWVTMMGGPGWIADIIFIHVLYHQ